MNKSAKSYSHEWSPKSKFPILFPAKPEKYKIREIKLPRKISRHTVNCERVCFSCNLGAFVSRFQNHAFGNCVNFSGKKVTAPKYESNLITSSNQGLWECVRRRQFNIYTLIKWSVSALADFQSLSIAKTSVFHRQPRFYRWKNHSVKVYARAMIC